MILLLFLIPLQPSPWQPGEGLRLWSQAGSLSAGAEGWGDHTGGSTLARDTLGRGRPWWGPKARSPGWLWSCWGAWGAGTIPCRVPASSATGDGTQLEEKLPGRFRGGDRPGGDASRISKGGDGSFHHNHTGKGFHDSPSLFSHCISFDISPGRAAGGRDKPAPCCRQSLFKLPNEVLWVLAG